MLNSFQSTLRRTERLVISNIFPPVLNFNPRSDERSDLRMYQVHRESHYFNPRSDERSDCIQKVSGYKGIIFQSTLRRTERHFKFCSSWKSIYFNPRSDERSDLTPILIYNISIINFNPRSDERSDLKSLNQTNVLQISIHAPTNGATS